MTTAARANVKEGGARDFGATGQLDAGFVGRTYRSTLLLAGVGLLYLAAYGQVRLLWPAALGVGVGIGLLYGTEILVRGWLSVERAKSRRNPKAAPSRMPRRTIAIVLIKYLSAFLLLWYIAGHWDMARIAAFAGGVCLVQVSIVTRALSRVLIAGWGQDAQASR